LQRYSRRAAPRSETPEIQLVGYVPDLAFWYRSAHVVVVPLRAGTGTRIKIVEAMSYARAVVTTSIGMEGLEVEDGVHVLIGDTTEEFTELCLRLIQDARERERLGRNARALCERMYSPAALAKKLGTASFR
jgi:glycosyltransferase involved in cell wall biosynthesis